MKETLINKFEEKSAVIGIVGLGYVGLPLALRYCEVGYKVIGFDIDPDKINSLSSGKTYIEHISEDSIKQAIKKGFESTVDFSRAIEVDALILCVPTPLDDHREPDLSFVVDTLKSLLPFIKTGQVVSLESTTYPGTTEEVLKPLIEAAGFEVGKDVFLVYSPEREDPANKEYSTHNIPKVCGGSTQECLAVGISLYQQIIERIVAVSSTKAAEMTKLLENIHRAVNIGLVNEMKIVADKMGIDIYEVIDAAATKPFGFVPYYPGPGLGGHCIPIDPFYLTWKAKEYGLNTRFIELAGEINTSMPQYVISKISDGLNAHKKSINGSKILILGIAYKKDVDDMRESPAVEIMSLLMGLGGNINYSDPHVPYFKKMRRYMFDMESIALTGAVLKMYDCVVLVTDHQKFNYDEIKNHAKLIVDTRGIYRQNQPNIIRA